MGEKRVLHMDFETFSDVDIGKCGLYRYMEAPVFEILLLSYALDDGPIRTVDFTAGETLPAEFLAALLDENTLVSAWNSAFERNAMRTVWGSLCPPIERFDDPMLLAARCGLPLSLKDAGAAIGLREDEAKLRDGRALIRFFCQPCTPTTANGGRRRNLPKDSPEKWERFKEYNAQDVVAERAIRNKLLQWLPQPQEELEFWWLDQKINDKGIRVDLDLARQAVAMSNRRKEELTQEAKALTGLENPNSVAQAKRWLEEQEGHAFPSLNKKEIAGIEDELTSDKSKQFLALRSEAAKSSVSKYEAMLRAATHDEHVKGCFQFYGAGRTGRAAGRLVQLQNLPQNHLDTLDQCRRMVKNGDYENIAACYGSVTRPLSELIRTALLPETGCKFLVADFSAIEARVIAWIAGEQWVLDAFAAGKDIYCETASQMFKVPVVKHGVNGELRAKGKVAVLACNYGGGVNALRAFGADKMGMTEAEMQNTVDLYRRANPRTVALWNDLERAATSVVEHKGNAKAKCGIRFTFERGILWMTLPSGRRIAYLRARMEDDPHIPGKLALTYQDTKGSGGRLSTWGGKIVENCVQATARDLLRDAMLRLDAAGYDIRAHVHDEVIISEPIGGRSVEDAAAIMGAPCAWAPGLPLRADGYETPYYRKD